ncbi:hypothetical protein F4803DRAFT_527965 [Xylaria telfairii]|nr:hypothetical protein F4803DRAFT_527965 [Xylaria telfairii]
MDFEMAPSPSSDTAGGNRRRSLTPTATVFTPKAMEAKKEVLHSSFISQTVPNAHRYAGVVGLCTVPEDQAGMNDLGWHVADFLAFRALLCGDNPPKAQTWLAMCNIPALVEANPDRYIHGKDKRLVGSAARPKEHQEQGRLIEREDDIQVETSSESLKEKFISAVKQKLGIAMKRAYPLLLIICGVTSLEQDIYFGTIDADNVYTLKDLRHELGNSINHIEATVVTPSLFSAGWQINTSFGVQAPMKVRGDRYEFLARQFGGVFSQDLSKSFVGWNCPALDGARVDPLVRKERFPGPVCPSDEVKALMSQLKIKIQSLLVGGLSTSHADHSFSFRQEDDEWERLLRDRERSVDYRALVWYEQKWTKLPTAQILESTDTGYAFLENAFGATKESQLYHIKCLIKESYLAWPDHWASNFGQETKQEFERFMDKEQPDELECHEIFNVLEHRARQSILADAVVQYFDLPMPHNQRSREWDCLKWKQQLSEIDRSSLIKYFGPVLGCVPGPNLPPGINQNIMSKLQRRLESGASYVRAALGIRFLTSQDSSKVAAIDRIESFLREVKVKQAELLASNPEVHLLCRKWLSSIDMPTCGLSKAISVSRAFGAPEDTIDILDSEGEYEVYEGGDVQSSDAASFTVTGNVGDESGGQQLSSELFGVSITLQPQVTAAAEHLEGVYLQQIPWVVPEIRIANPPSVVSMQVREDEGVNFSQEEVDLDAEQTRIITALQTTNKTEEREKLTKELLKLLQRSKSLGLPDTEQSNDAMQNSASEETSGEAMATPSFTETKNGWHSGGETQVEAGEHATATRMPHMPIQKPQSPDSALPPHKWVERSGGAVHQNAPHTPAKSQQQTIERKTPPHLRGLGGGRRK